MISINVVGFFDRKKWAEERLRSLNSTDVALNYLLKQRSSSLKKYILAHIDTEKHISFYTIEVEFVQGQLRYRIGLEKEPIFSSIADLLKYYKNNDHDRIKLNMRIRPTEPCELVPWQFFYRVLLLTPDEDEMGGYCAKSFSASTL